jgi:nitroreductase
MEKTGFHPLNNYTEYSLSEMEKRSEEFYQEMKKRRSVRQFSERPIPRKIIEYCVLTAGTAPSGANMQPWTFIIVSDPKVKKKIRQEAEKTEQEFYTKKPNLQWIEELAPLGTDASKPFLEEAPYLIVIFAQRHSFSPDGSKRGHYYVNESVGISAGLLISALHHAGIACLTYTPSKMGFLNRILSQPSNEKPYLVIVAGYPDKDATLPDIEKKPADEIIKFI